MMKTENRTERIDRAAKVSDLLKREMIHHPERKSVIQARIRRVWAYGLKQNAERQCEEMGKARPHDNR